MHARNLLPDPGAWKRFWSPRTVRVDALSRMRFETPFRAGWHCRLRAPSPPRLLAGALSGRGILRPENKPPRGATRLQDRLMAHSRRLLEGDPPQDLPVGILHPTQVPPETVLVKFLHG